MDIAEKDDANITKLGTPISFRDPLESLGFARVSHVLTLFTELSDGAFRLYCLLLKYAQQKERCYPGENRLAEDLKVHRTTISRRFGELETFGLVTRERRVGTSSMTWIEPLHNCTRLAPVVANLLQRRSNSATATVAETLRKEEQEEKEEDVASDQDIVDSLTALGVYESTARELTSMRPPELIAGWVAYVRRDGDGLRNPAAFLVAKLRDGEQPPAVERPENDRRRYIEGPYAHLIQH